VDSSAFRNDGVAVGTTIVPGPFTNARFFDGAHDVVIVGNPTDHSLDFQPDESFTIQLWFKTEAWEGVIIRRGLAPLPGFMISIHRGRVVGMIGNSERSLPPDTLLFVTSDEPLNDGRWHFASLVRNRARETLSLYIDGSLAADPVSDQFPVPLTNNRPLTMGRWENDRVPGFFRGTIAEVRIVRGVIEP
jgi:hypothetical protein